jgi:hypothetical protein
MWCASLGSFIDGVVSVQAHVTQYPEIDNQLPCLMEMDTCCEVSMMTGWSGVYSARNLWIPWRSGNMAARWWEELWIWHEMPPYKSYHAVSKSLVFIYAGMSIWPLRDGKRKAFAQYSLSTWGRQGCCLTSLVKDVSSKVVSGRVICDDAIDGCLVCI